MSVVCRSFHKFILSTVTTLSLYQKPTLQDMMGKQVSLGIRVCKVQQVREDHQGILDYLVHRDYQGNLDFPVAAHTVQVCFRSIVTKFGI